MENKKVEQLLESILQELSLLTVQTKVNALQRFKVEFLTSDMRRIAYEKFDGVKTLKEISDEINCKLNTLQVFVALLIENDLVGVEKQGNSKIIHKDTSKIAVYYAQKDLQKEDNHE